MSADLGDHHSTIAEKRNAGGLGAANATSGGGSELLYEPSEQWQLRRLTIDLDRTVSCTGAQVARTARGFNPHHRKLPSY
jgi:hypothetical protein